MFTAGLTKSGEVSDPERFKKVLQEGSERGDSKTRRHQKSQTHKGEGNRSNYLISKSQEDSDLWIRSNRMCAKRLLF